MKFRKEETLLGVLLGTGLYLLDDLRKRLPENMDDIKGRARETYEPHPTAWAAPLKLFAAKKIPAYSEK
jgi:hypothetical protein